MTRRELLQLAAERIGSPVPDYVLEHALRRGFVTRPALGADRWARYEPSHLAELVDYLTTRSRRARAASRQA